MFEGSTASGAERAYRRAVDKLTELLVAEGAIHAVRLKQKSKTKCKKKIFYKSFHISFVFLFTLLISSLKFFFAMKVFCLSSAT